MSIEAQEVLCSSLTGTISLDLEGKWFADHWTATISRKGRDMNEDVGATLCRSDESEAPIIVPLRESTLGAHANGLTGCYADRVAVPRGVRIIAASRGDFA